MCWGATNLPTLYTYSNGVFGTGFHDTLYNISKLYLQRIADSKLIQLHLQLQSDTLQ